VDPIILICANSHQLPRQDQLFCGYNHNLRSCGLRFPNCLLQLHHTRLQANLFSSRRCLKLLRLPVYHHHQHLHPNCHLLDCYRCTKPNKLPCRRCWIHRNHLCTTQCHRTNCFCQAISIPQQRRFRASKLIRGRSCRRSYRTLLRLSHRFFSKPHPSTGLGMVRAMAFMNWGLTF